MFAGIDFGTSNCVLGVWRDNAATLIPLDGDKRELASNMFISRSEFKEQTPDEAELQRRLATARSEQAREAARAREDGRQFQLLGGAALESMIRQTMAREALVNAQALASGESASSALRRGNRCDYGESAQKRFIDDPESGHLIKSPKTFLGSNLRQEQLDFFKDVSASLLGSIKSRTEAQLDTPIENVVLGRPVHFQGTKGIEGDRQAENILRGAAQQAGFKDIEFMLEPVAAALHFEERLTEDLCLIVLDIGGGTTDCSMINVGPSHRHNRQHQQQHRENVLGYSAGRRSGGVDLDIKLAINVLMPHLGRGRCDVPDQMYWNAAKVNDIPAQNRFLSSACGYELEQYLSRAPAHEKVLIRRLIALHARGRTLRLSRSAELAKIQLTDHASYQLPLHYLDDNLVVDVTRDQFGASIERDIHSFARLIDEVENQAGTKPDMVYVTGGTAYSPIVQNYLNAHLAGYEVRYGDLFGSVASGLTTWAGQVFQ